jgi:hypothetical protein
MADVQDPVSPGTPAIGNAGADASAVADPRFDPERVAALEAYYERTNPVLEQYKDDFTPLLEDEKFREFYRSSRESYYDMQKRIAAERDAEIPESEKRILSALDERLGKFKPVLDDYESRAQAQERAAKDATAQFTRENLEYAQRLVAEQKLTSEEVSELARYAAAIHEDLKARGEHRFVPLEEAYKRVYGRAEAKVTQAKPTPKSLRSTAGATGVPGASRTIEDRADLAKPGGVTRHILGVLNSQRKTG